MGKGKHERRTRVVFKIEKTPGLPQYTVRSLGNIEFAIHRRFFLLLLNA